MRVSAIVHNVLQRDPFYFIFFIFKLYKMVLVLPNIKMNLNEFMLSEMEREMTTHSSILAWEIHRQGSLAKSPTGLSH